MKLLNAIEFFGALFLIFLSLAIQGALSVFIFVLALAILVSVTMEGISYFRSLSRWGECVQCSRKVYEVGFERNGEVYVPEKHDNRWKCIECANPSIKRS